MRGFEDTKSRAECGYMNQNLKTHLFSLAFVWCVYVVRHFYCYLLAIKKNTCGG